jgi:hypothetical protein
MPIYDQLDYEPLLKDKGTRSAIMRAKSQAVHKAGPTRPIQVKLYSEVDESAEPLVATAVLSKDGVWLDVPFTMPDGTHGFCAYDYQELTTKIAGFK